MERIQVMTNAKKKDQSIHHALHVLNEAAETSADQIRAMIEQDYLKFKHLISDIRPNISDVIDGFQQSGVESFNQTKEKIITATNQTTQIIDEAAHKNPWPFIGIAVIISGISGYILASKLGR